MPTVTLGVLTVVFGLDMIACLAAVADRSARAEAWRRIAAEQRWNHEHIAARGRAPPSRTSSASPGVLVRADDLPGRCPDGWLAGDRPPVFDATCAGRTR